MKLEQIYNIKRDTFLQSSMLSFRNVSTVRAVSRMNIGNCKEGFIGKINVRKADNTPFDLNLFKKYLQSGYENYLLKNENGDIVGEIVFVAKKIFDYDKLQNSADPSHIFVDELRNYSNPNTPYYKKGLEYHKDIGLRLMQIALQRSEEALCNGSVKLIAKNESKEWYKNIIGMTEEFPETLNCGFKFCVHNPNAMILPAQSKERLANLRGGLNLSKITN